MPRMFRDLRPACAADLWSQAKGISRMVVCGRFRCNRTCKPRSVDGINSSELERINRSIELLFEYIVPIASSENGNRLPGARVFNRAVKFRIVLGVYASRLAELVCIFVGHLACKRNRVLGVRFRETEIVMLAGLFLMGTHL